MTLDLTIQDLGAQGDGVATGREGPVYVPFTLQGERVRAEPDGEGRARLVEVLAPSPDRREPVCRHFGACGGCALQHMRPPAYLAWKQDQVTQAFAQRGLEAPVAEVVAVPEGARRRAVFAARRTRAGVLFGFRQRFSHAIVDIAECPVLHPAIVAAVPGLRELTKPLLSRRGEARLTVLDTGTGLDVAIENVRDADEPSVFAALSRLAESLDLARLTVNGETALQRRQPALSFGGVSVVPPPGAFVQATVEAEQAMAARVLSGVAGAARIADLFAGLGTFALPLARQAEVLAADLDAGLLDALAAAARTARGLRPLRTLPRDLFHEPLSAKELAGFDAVVFDPPRAGARTQAEALAASAVPKVVAVSCNPATLARDARILVDGGYRLVSVEPIDQFLYSPHIEVVAVFER